MDPSPLHRPFLALRDELRAVYATYGGIQVFLAEEIVERMLRDMDGPSPRQGRCDRDVPGGTCPRDPPWPAAALMRRRTPEVDAILTAAAAHLAATVADCT